MNASNRYTERLTMDRNNPIHLDIQPPDVGLEVDRLCIGDFGRLGSRRERCKNIGFDQKLLLA